MRSKRVHVLSYTADARPTSHESNLDGLKLSLQSFVYGNPLHAATHTHPKTWAHYDLCSPEHSQIDAETVMRALAQDLMLDACQLNNNGLRDGGLNINR